MGAEDYYGCKVQDLTTVLSDEIRDIISAIETQTTAMYKDPVIADHFLFHALLERTRKPVAHIVTSSDGVTYLHEMHTTAIRQEGTFDKDMIVVHYDERTNKYRVLLEPKRSTSKPPIRDGMSNTLILPSMKMLYGEAYGPTTPQRRVSKIDDKTYHVEVTSSPGGMEVMVDDIHLDAYSPLTQAHVLTEIDLQGAAGGGHIQIPLRPDGEAHNA